MSMTATTSAATAESQRRLGVLRGEILSSITKACQSVPFLVEDDLNNLLEICLPGILKVVRLEQAAIASASQCYSSYILSAQELADIRPGALVAEAPQDFVSHADKIRAGVFSPDDPLPPSMFAKDATATETYEVKP